MMVVFTPFILLWGFWFWGIFLLESILLIYCLEEDKPGFAIFTTVVVLILISIWSDFISFKWIFINPGVIFLYLLGYIVIGAFYSIIKYFFYLTDMKRKWDKAFTEYCENIADLKGADKLKFSELPEAYQRGAAQYIEEEMGYSSLPTFSNSTGRITFWMGYWPWSLFWTILDNPFRWLFEEIKSGLIGVYRRMHSKIIGDRYDTMRKWKDK